MKCIWLGKAYKVAFEGLIIDEEGVSKLQEMFNRIHNVDYETSSLYTSIYKEKYPRSKKSFDWNISSLRGLFRGKEVTPGEFINYVSQQPKYIKRQLYYISKEIFKKK